MQRSDWTSMDWAIMTHQGKAGPESTSFCEFQPRQGRLKITAMIGTVALFAVYGASATSWISAQEARLGFIAAGLVTAVSLFLLLPRRLVLRVDSGGLMLRDFLYVQRYPWDDVVSRFRVSEGLAGKMVAFDHPWFDSPTYVIEVRLPSTLGASAEQVAATLNEWRNHHRLPKAVAPYRGLDGISLLG